MSKEQLQTLSDEDILAAAEQIIEEEQALQKSMDAAAPAAVAEAVQPEGEAKKDEKKKDDQELEKGCGEDMDMKKSQADIEGKETGGLAPSVQGNLPDAGNGDEGGSEDEANPKYKKDKKKEEGGEESKATQEGGSQDQANQKGSKEHLMRDGAPAAEGGGKDGQGQQGSSEDQANPKAVVNMLRKSLEEMTKVIKSLNARIAAIETTKPVDEKEEMRKSLQGDVIETLAKSYNKKIRSLESENEELKKSFSAQFEELKKSQDKLAKENQEFKEKLSKPARTRETATAFQPIEKGNSEQAQPLVKSKAEALEKLEELRKSGKVSGDELISFNVSGNMTPNVRKQLGLK